MSFAGSWPGLAAKAGDAAAATSELPGVGVAGANGIDAAALAALLASPLPCIAVGPDGRLREANAAARGVAPMARAGSPILEILGAGLDRLLALAAANDTTVVCLGELGAPPHLLVKPLGLADGGVLLVLSSLAAVEDAEQARYEKTPYAVVRLDPQGTIRFANSRAQALWSERSNSAGFVGEVFADLFPEPAATLVRTQLREMLATQTSRTVRVSEGFTVKAGGHDFRSEPQLTFVPFYAPGLQICGAVVHIHERIVDALRIALRAAAAGEAASGVSVEDWRDRMRAILDLLQIAVPHDRAVLSVLSHDKRWARPILVHPPADPPMPPGWAPVPPAELARMQQGPFTIDLNALLARMPELKKNTLIASHLAAGLVANAVLPVPFGQPEATLTLCSKQTGYFEEDEPDTEWSDDTWPQPPFRSVLSLGLDPLLVGMLRRVERQEELAMRAMAHRIGCSRTVPAATHALLAALVGQFGWDHAALFAVEPGADGGQLRLFAQFPESEDTGQPHPLALPPGYTQPLYVPPLGVPLDLARARVSGMLGSAVRAGTPLVAENTQERDEHGDRPHFFRSPASLHGSAMTVPIELDGRTRWVLDTVSRHQNAFHAEDGEKAGPLVRRLARQLATRRSAWLNEMLIEQIEQGVVVTDAVGTLLRANARARDMLGLPQGSDLPEGRLLSDHASDDATRAFLAGTASTGSVRLGPLGGLGSEVRVGKCQDTTETRDLVWLLDGADEKDWTYDRTYIEATVQEVARQVRGPLLMASSLAGRIARTATAGAAPAIERVRAEIGKADITFERLAEAIGARRDPRRSDDEVDMAALLQEIVELLPERDRGRLRSGVAASGLLVRGDRERLRFVLRTLVGNLLACNPERIAVDLAPVSDGVAARLRVTLATSDPAPEEATGPDTLLEQAAQAARESAALAFETIGNVLRAHGGTVERTENGFTLELPLLDADSPS